MDKRAVETDNAPDAVGPYSQAIKTMGMVFCSGQIPVNPKTGELVKGSIEIQVKQVMENIACILDEAGTDLGSVAKTTVFLKDLGNFPVVNEIYGSYFNEPYPARVTIGVKDLPLGADIEIDAIAVLK
ncbi:RidA family protein [Spirochaetota bacterium]